LSAVFVRETPNTLSRTGGGIRAKKFQKPNVKKAWAALPRRGIFVLADDFCGRHQQEKGDIMFFKKKKKVQIPISKGAAMAVDTLVDYNMRLFMELVELSKKYGYQIDSPQNRAEFSIGLLAPETLYAFQVFSRDKANHICDLTEYFLGTFENDDTYTYGINGAFLDISQLSMLSIYKAYEEEYLEAEKEYLQGDRDPISLPINKVLFIMLAVVLDYNFDDKGLSELQEFHRFCVGKISSHLSLWKTLDEKIDYIWTE